MFGWSGTILRVDLTSGKIEKEPLREELGRNYIGGRGINVRILHDEVKAGTAGLAPENVLIFGTGPLSGAMQASGRLNITAICPENNMLGDTNAGSHFSPELKYAGYDHIIFTGKSNKPVYLWINNDEVALRDAGHLWGKMTDKTREMIREELGDPEIQVTCIGPAGENLVNIACVAVGTHGFGGRFGMGAVMGSKNLKAVAVRGTKGVRVAKPEAFRALNKELLQQQKQNPAYPAMSTFGTTRHLSGRQAIGNLAMRNAQVSGRMTGYDNISPQTLREKYTLKETACFACPIHCRAWFKIAEGPYAGLSDVGMEFSTQLGWGVLNDNPYAPSLYKAFILCNQYGLDQSQTGQLVAAATEWYEKGIITRQDTEGIELGWGNHEAMIQMIHKIANRQGIGALLGQGGVHAARKLGQGAEDCISHVKGIVRTTGEIRGLWSAVLGMATSTRGADHLRGATTRLDMIDKYEGCAQIVYATQTVDTVADALEVCKFNTAYVSMGMTLPVMARLFSLATGIDVDEQGMKEIADRIWNLERSLQVREGITRKDDCFSGRYFNEPIHGGPHDGIAIDLAKWNRMLDEYYDLNGWDRETGIPTRSRLESLGLKDIADELTGLGKLPHRDAKR